MKSFHFQTITLNEISYFLVCLRVWNNKSKLYEPENDTNYQKSNIILININRTAIFCPQNEICIISFEHTTKKFLLAEMNCRQRATRSFIFRFISFGVSKKLFIFAFSGISFLFLIQTRRQESDLKFGKNSNRVKLCWYINLLREKFSKEKF